MSKAACKIILDSGRKSEMVMGCVKDYVSVFGAEMSEKDFTDMQTYFDKVKTDGEALMLKLKTKFGV